MTLSKEEIQVLCSGLEIGFNKNPTHLTEKGVRKLAKIYCKLTSKILPIEPESTLDSITEMMLNNINYQKK